MICNTIAESIVGSWSKTIVAAGGAAPSAPTKSAANTFLESLMSAAIYSKMKSVNIIAPDNLVAASTPIIATSGFPVWFNRNFAPADLSVNGLLGNGSSKSFDTGIVPSSTFSSSTDGGITVYNFTSANGPYDWIGCYVSATSTCNLYHFNNSVLFEAFNESTGRTTAASTLSGYWSGNRTAANSSDIYFANSLNPHASVGAIATSGGTLPSLSLEAWALNANSVITAWVPERLSFMAVHAGLTTAESLDFFNAVQALRTALGGGFV